MPHIIPPTMRAMEIHAGELREVALTTPKPGPGEVLIRVAYVGVNRADLLQLEGKYAPPEGTSPLLGLEVSGWVAALGSGASGFQIGQEVCALLSGGGYAEYVRAPVSLTLALPAGITLTQAASLPEATATAVMVLRTEANLQPGEYVLVHGGTSGVGLWMCQLVHALGGVAIGVVGGPKKANLLHSLNILAIDHQTQDWAAQAMSLTENRGLDVIIDTLGGPAFEKHLRLLRPRGRLITLSMLEGSALPEGTKMTRLLMNQLQWRGATLRNRSLTEKAEIIDFARTRIWPMLEKGSIRPVLDEVFPLEHAKKALIRMQERLQLGKILLEISAD